ncbi:hypothetical protein P171DRAFT_484430 [Karstenula rhodostoma CBS 690.94]|uniref:Uncharacterized protein n=1 Tax=Karstenula rhodostoma CBS 690.94 TaxID=1392251 RepID=A0A9P4PMY4_9PLEO|nr:hypothetical protein P171DRAFT_484430 [Karstenula rhodostoma CBS 690.94]
MASGHHHDQTAFANGSDAAAVVPPQSLLAAIRDSIKANAIRGYNVFINILFVLAILSTILANLLKATPTFIKTIPTLLYTAWVMFRTCPFPGHFSMGCALAVYIYAFITDPYLFGTPKEWLVGAFGLTCYCSLTCLCITMLNAYAPKIRAAVEKAIEEDDHLRETLKAVNWKDARTEKRSDPAIPQFGRAAYIEEEKGGNATPVIGPDANAERPAHIEQMRRFDTMPKFGHAAYIRD